MVALPSSSTKTSSSHLSSSTIYSTPTLISKSRPSKSISAISRSQSTTSTSRLPHHALQDTSPTSTLFSTTPTGMLLLWATSTPTATVGFLLQLILAATCLSIQLIAATLLSSTQTLPLAFHPTVLHPHLMSLSPPLISSLIFPGRSLLSSTAPSHPPLSTQTTFLSSFPSSTLSTKATSTPFAQKGCLPTSGRPTGRNSLAIWIASFLSLCLRPAPKGKRSCAPQS